MYKNWLIAGTHGRSAWALDVSNLAAQPLNAVAENPSNQITIRSIYPDPLYLNTSTSLHLILDGISGKDLTIQIINTASGALVFQSYSQLNSGELELHVPFNLVSGSYLVKIITSNGKSAAKEISIIR
jgi:hypothetical protein